MSVLAVIPARLAATRLPQKPLRLLAGVPLVIRVAERVRALGFGDLIVATDSSEVATAVTAAGFRAAMTRGDHPSGTDRVAEVARAMGAGFNVILNVQGDEPFVESAALEGAVQMVRTQGFDVGTAAAVASPEILRDPNVVKVVCRNDAQAMYFSRAPIPWLREASDRDVLATSALVRQHVGVYAYTPAALERWVGLPVHPLEQVERLEQLRPLAAGMSIGVAILERPPQSGVDTEADLVRANARWNELYAGRT